MSDDLYLCSHAAACSFRLSCSNGVPHVPGDPLAKDICIYNLAATLIPVSGSVTTDGDLLAQRTESLDTVTLVAYDYYDSLPANSVDRRLAREFYDALINLGIRK